MVEIAKRYRIAVFPTCAEKCGLGRHSRTRFTFQLFFVRKLWPFSRLDNWTIIKQQSEAKMTIQTNNTGVAKGFLVSFLAHADSLVERFLGHFWPPETAIICVARSTPSPWSLAIPHNVGHGNNDARRYLDFLAI